ncbi:MAG: helix-turn-helix domain-containing protein [Dehalococcoidia bacterium]
MDPRAGHGATSIDSSFLLTVPEAARLLRIWRNLTYELIHQKALPHVRLGRRILVPQQRLESWVEEEAKLFVG